MRTFEAPPVTDHPPAIPAIQVRQLFYYWPNTTSGSPLNVPQNGPVMPCPYVMLTPLGLSPEQPARIGGHDE